LNKNPNRNLIDLIVLSLDRNSFKAIDQKSFFDDTQKFQFDIQTAVVK